MFPGRWLFPLCLGITVCSAPHAELLDLSLFQRPQAEPAPSVEPARPDAEKSCVEIYLEITELLERKEASKSGYWNDRKNQLAGAVGFTFMPAWFYLGYTAIGHLQQTEQAFDATKRIGELRAAAADKLCFVR